MPYKKAYRLQINPADTTDVVTIDICRKSDFVQFGGGVFMQVISLNDELGRTPESSLTIKSIDNSEDKFTKIKAKQAVFSFFSNNSYNLNFFANGEDDEWVVLIYLNSEASVLFRGFLDLSAVNEDFQPNPNVVTLTATDNIGLLKDIPLTKPDGITPRGKFTVIQYIAWALQKTNLQLNINCVQNLMEESSHGVSYFSSCYLDAKTFEKEISECEDCYTVLEKILGQDCMLCQWLGEWWIVRIDEMQAAHYTQHIFDYTGLFVQQANNDLLAFVSGPYPRVFLNDDTNISLIPKHGVVKETYNFDFPKEIVDNIDFSRGDTDPFYTAPSGINKVIKRYTLEDWAKRKAPTNNAADFEAYIERVFENDYEKERYLVLTPQTNASTGFGVVTPAPIPLEEKDKFDFSIDFSFFNDIAAGTFTFFVFHLRLIADDGTFWVLDAQHPDADNKNPWLQTNSTFTSIFRPYQYQIHQADKDTDWKTVSVDAYPLPRSGDLYIDLYTMNQISSAGGDDVNIKYQNLRFDYRPYINGSYAKYRGQYNKVSTSGNYKSIVDEQVYVSDSPKKLFKGALFTAVGGYSVTGTVTFSVIGNSNLIGIPGADIRNSFGQYVKVTGSDNNNGMFFITQKFYNAVEHITLLQVRDAVINETKAGVTLQDIKFQLAGRFYNGAVFPAGPPDDSYLHPLGFTQAYSVWNQFNRTMRLIDCTISHLDTGDGHNLIPDLPFNISVADVNPHVSNKYFLPMHIEQDFDNNVFKTKLAEVWDGVIGKLYTDPLEFRYISDRS